MKAEAVSFMNLLQSIKLLVCVGQLCLEAGIPFL